MCMQVKPFALLAIRCPSITIVLLVNSSLNAFIVIDISFPSLQGYSTIFPE